MSGRTSSILIALVMLLGYCAWFAFVRVPGPLPAPYPIQIAATPSPSPSAVPTMDAEGD